MNNGSCEEHKTVSMEWNKDCKDCNRRIGNKIRDRLPNAPKKLYELWLKRYMLGNEHAEITHWYDYPFERESERYFLSNELIDTPPLYGASSLKIIFDLRDTDVSIDKHIKSMLFEPKGHNQFYIIRCNGSAELIGNTVFHFSDLVLFD